MAANQVTLVNAKYKFVNWNTGPDEEIGQGTIWLYMYVILHVSEFLDHTPSGRHLVVSFVVGLLPSLMTAFCTGVAQFRSFSDVTSRRWRSFAQTSLVNGLACSHFLLVNLILAIMGLCCICGGGSACEKKRREKNNRQNYAERGSSITDNTDVACNATVENYSWKW